MPSKSENVIEISLPSGEAISLITQVLQDMSASVTEVDEQKGVILAKKGVSMASWGENIRVLVEGTSENHSRVRVESRSSLGTTLTDWGTNANNLAEFEQRITHKLAQQRSVPGNDTASLTTQSGSTAPTPQITYPYPTYTPRPLKDRSIALILEILPGLFGLQGFGWIYSGNTVVGIFWLVGVLTWDIIAALIIALTAGFGCFCTIPVNLALLTISAVFLSSYINQHPELFGQRLAP